MEWWSKNVQKKVTARYDIELTAHDPDKFDNWVASQNLNPSFYGKAKGATDLFREKNWEYLDVL